MRTWSWIVGLVAGWWLVGAVPAAALCRCGDVDGCGSAIACQGATPGDDCSPPRNATCKIIKGSGTVAVCCCGCTRGPGPISCVYMPVTEQMPALRAGAAVCKEAMVQRLADKAVPKAERALMKADAACSDGKNAAPQAGRAQRGLDKLKGKIEKLEARGKIAPGCAATYGALIDTFVQGIEKVETTGDPGLGSTTTTTAPTTTTTLSGTKTCSGSFTLYIPDPSEVDFSFSCTGATSAKTGFVIAVPGRDVTNFLEPAGFTCLIVNGGGGDDVVDCSPLAGTFDSATSRMGRLHLVPAPAAGMGGSLTIEQGAGTLGPFSLTGP